MSREMKDSEIEWIGDIPKSWLITKTKNIFYRSKDKSYKDNPTILSLARAGVRIRDISTNEGQLASDYSQYNSVEPGDFLLNPMDLYSGANCNVSNVSGVISPAYFNLRVMDENNCPWFFDYYFKTQYWAMAMFAHGTGVSHDYRWTINNETLMNYYAPLTTFKEQEKISQFLNTKVKMIDELIDQTKSSIEDYKLLKQSIITEAATKGLDKNVEMKDTRIEWIGEIPRHWSIAKLKHCIHGSLQYGANASGVSYQENLPRYIRITDITNNNNLSDENMLSLPVDIAGNYLLKDYDLLFARSGATVGKTFLYKENYGKAAFAGYLIKASFESDDLAKYVYYYTLSKAYEQWKNGIFIQATIQNIGANKYANMELPIPDIAELPELLSYLEKSAVKFDLLINQKRLLLTELEKYKKSLIYEYVTGKKEVE